MGDTVVILAVFLALFQLYGAAEICCPNGVGCFTDDPPFNGLPLPDCPAGFNLKYTMFTRNNRDAGQLVDANTVPSVYSGSRRTVFFVHGWNSDGTSAWLTNIKNAFLDREDVNAVIVDWGGGAQLLNYFKAAMNTRSVGSNTALVYQNLLNQAGSSADRMWCIGHSLGAHVCGHTGMRMPTGRQLGRVTGLDPAGPAFEGSSDKTIGINPTSGTFVDILHTAYDLGTTRDIGHIDFYPAGGRNQPGCFRQEFNDETFQKWDADSPEQYNSCDHSRAYEYFIESLKNDCFASRRKCTDFNTLPGSCSECVCGSFPCATMGYGTDSSCQKQGLFYLDVTSAAPFCQN